MSTPAPVSVPKFTAVRLTLPSAALKRLQTAGIRCAPDVSLEYQRSAERYVLRGRESGGAAKDIGRYVGYCGENGEPLPWFIRPDSLTPNADHAIALAQTLVSVEVFRYEHTYELLIARHTIAENRDGKRPKAKSELVFRGWQGQLPLDFVGKDKTLAGNIAPEFFDRAGEPRQLSPPFVAAVQAITRAVNCVNCSHAHLLIKPEPPPQQQQARKTEPERAPEIESENEPTPKPTEEAVA
jgi:hypothetical protein